MEITKLFELLTLLDGVTSTQWDKMVAIHHLIENDTVVIKESKWADKYKQDNPSLYPLNLKNFKNWSTMEKCINLHFTNDNGKLLCKVKIYNGNSFNGYREDLRFDALLELPESFLLTLEEPIDWALDGYAENAYEEYLETKRKNWIKKKKDSLLK